MTSAFTDSFVLTVVSSETSSFGMRLCHQLESIEPVMFINGPKTAGAKATAALVLILEASADARPAFCIPTSKAMVRLSLSLNFRNLPDQ